MERSDTLLTLTLSLPYQSNRDNEQRESSATRSLKKDLISLELFAHLLFFLRLSLSELVLLEIEWMFIRMEDRSTTASPDVQ